MDYNYNYNTQKSGIIPSAQPSKRSGLLQHTFNTNDEDSFRRESASSAHYVINVSDEEDNDYNSIAQDNKRVKMEPRDEKELDYQGSGYDEPEQGFPQSLEWDNVESNDSGYYGFTQPPTTPDLSLQGNPPTPSTPRKNPPVAVKEPVSVCPREEEEISLRRRPTPSQDEEYYLTLWHNVASFNRIVRFTCDHKTHGWLQWKIFKKDRESGFFRRFQSISLTPTEMEKFLLQLPMFVERARVLMHTNKPARHTCKEFNLSPEEDAQFYNWNFNISETTNRLVRVSTRIYNNESPFISTYVSLKLFKRDENGQFTKTNQVSFNFREAVKMEENTSLLMQAALSNINKLY